MAAISGARSDAATAVALGPGAKVVYIGGYTSSRDFPIAGEAAQPKLNGSTNGFLAAVDVRSGKLLYSTYLGGTGEDRVTSIAVDAGGRVYVAGSTDSKNWPDVELARLGNGGTTDGFIVRFDPTGKSPPLGVRIGGSGEESLASIDLDSHGDIYAVGATNSPDFPVKGAHLGKMGSDFVVKISGKRFSDERDGIVWSRRIGGHGEDALLSVSAGLPGAIFVSGRSGSPDFPTTREQSTGIWKLKTTQPWRSCALTMAGYNSLLLWEGPATKTQAGITTKLPVCSRMPKGMCT